MKSQFLIGAPSSSSGKTTIALGLLRLLRNRGINVQPFKCGPDYIDPKHHTLAAKNQSINLDTFMMSEAHVKSLYSKYSNHADVMITEGVMGLFDGANKMQGSSAEIALLLDLPVVLVVNAKAMAYSAAPLLYGFKHFHKDLKIAGVLFNFVNTESHYDFLKDACQDVGIEPLGYVPSNDSIKIPSRHLGLTISPDFDFDTIIEEAALHMAKTVNIERLLELTLKDSTIIPEKTTLISPKKKIKISVAKDEAFNFIYHENLEAFKNFGEVAFFSPIHDHDLPETDLLYLPGGYPELYLKELSANIHMTKKVKAFCEAGGKVIAECGGMMYLGHAILDESGNAFPMAGFLDLETSLQNAKLSLGYRFVSIVRKTYKGHEFHYSSCKEKSTILQIGEVKNTKGKSIQTPIYQQKNVRASYIHFYWGENQDMIECMI
jgi:cobyrinic acid a,c-diamide synthase